MGNRGGEAGVIQRERFSATRGRQGIASTTVFSGPSSKILSFPVHCIRANRHTLPASREGAGGDRGSGGAVGVAYLTWAYLTWKRGV